MKCVIILPNLLFKNNNLINDKSCVYIIEHPVYFTMYNYNKIKLTMHRSTMKYYYDYIKNKYNCTVKYINHNKDIKHTFMGTKFKDIYMHDPHDHFVVNNLKRIFNGLDIKLHIHESDLFITKTQDLLEYQMKTQDKKLIQGNFYKWQRTRLNILMNKNGTPVGGKWSFDSDNREKFPKDFTDNYNINVVDNKYTVEAKIYVEKYFGNNPGNTDYYLPITYDDTTNHMKQFLKHRLKYFGKYQDGVNNNVFLGYHSLLAPLMNIGLILPIDIINQVLKYYNKNKQIKIQTVEGFIRQILGWREFCNFLYTYHFDKLVNNNYFDHHNRINHKIWYHREGSTGFKIIDELIEKTIKYGYLHHIERLMYIGNYLLLTRTKPQDVFIWFQSMFLDSYHVFMYPNVYGMSQFSAGNVMMTRPYFSSSNYLHNMSNYKRGSHYVVLGGSTYYWNDIWDSLYYYFIYNNINKFKNNYSLANAVNNWNDKSSSGKKEIIKLAQSYIDNYM